MCFISIITVNKDNAKGLERTIESVIAQKFSSYEFIVIDGDSKDGSKEVIVKYKNHIHYWVSEPDNGIYNAMNKGIIAAKGQYCLFLNSGDFLVHNAILNQVSSVVANEDIISGPVIRFSKKHNKTEIFAKISSPDFSFGQLLKYSLNHQATLIKKELFHTYGYYDENYRIVSDWIFFIKVLGLNNVSFKYIDFPISYYDIEGISRGKNNYYEKEIRPALKNIVPYRILLDYEYYFDINTHSVISNIKKYRLSNFLVKLIYFTIRRYDSVIKFVGKK